MSPSKFSTSKFETPKATHIRGFDFSKSSPRKDFINYNWDNENETLIDYDKIM